MDTDSEEVACSLTAAALGSRLRAWHALLSRSLIHRERVPGGVRLTVRPGSADTLRTLVERERECCPWIQAELSGDAVTLTAESAAGQAVLQVFGVPPTSR